jgi:hypothetical protein
MRLNFKTIQKNVEGTTFASYSAMTQYLSTGNAFSGQICSIQEGYGNEDPSALFVIYSDGGTLKPLQIATNDSVQELVNEAISDVEGILHLEGNAPSAEWTAAQTNHTKGMAFVVTTAGTYVGQECNVGDMIVCKADGTSASDADWFVIESNQPNMVLFDGAEPMFQNEIPVFSDMTGHKIESFGIKADSVLTVSSDNQLNVGGETALTSEQLAGIKNTLGIDASLIRTATLDTIGSGATTANFTLTGGTIEPGICYYIQFPTEMSYLGAITGTTFSYSGTTYTALINKMYQPITMDNKDLLTAQMYTPVIFQGALAFVYVNEEAVPDNTVLVSNNQLTTQGGALSSADISGIAEQIGVSTLTYLTEPFKMVLSSNALTATADTSGLSVDELTTIGQIISAGGVWMADFSYIASSGGEFTGQNPELSLTGDEPAAVYTGTPDHKSYINTTMMNTLAKTVGVLMLRIIPGDLSKEWQLINQIPKTDSSAEKLTTARTIDGVEFDGTKNITHFCVCSTAAGTAAKTVNLPGFTIAPNQSFTGARISVKFTNGSTAVSPTLSVNGGTAFPISWPGGALASIEAGQVLDMVFQFENTGGFNVIGSANNPNNVTNASGGATSDGEIPVFSDTTGKAIEGSGVNIENLADKNFVDQQVNGLAPMYEILALQALQIPFSAKTTVSSDDNTITLNLPSVVTSSPNGIKALKALIDIDDAVFYANISTITNISSLADESEITLKIPDIYIGGRGIIFGDSNITGKIIKALFIQCPIIALRCNNDDNYIRLVGIDSIIGDGVIYYPGGDTVKFTVE